MIPLPALYNTDDVTFTVDMHFIYCKVRNGDHGVQTHARCQQIGPLTAHIPEVWCGPASPRQPFCWSLACGSGAGACKWPALVAW